jgi:hypothetical protein
MWVNQPKFWGFVKKLGDDPCWLWSGGRVWSHGGKGYGALWHKGKCYLAHRLSWFIHNGDIPKGMFILHKCDNKLCVNPHHLYAGTHRDNMRDKVDRGQSGIKITKDHVSEIRKLYETGTLRLIDLAKEFGISTSQVWNVVRRKQWDHVR